MAKVSDVMLKRDDVRVAVEEFAEVVELLQLKMLRGVRRWKLHMCSTWK